MWCRHCQQAPVSRPRGLCWSCYYTPEIRTRYPVTSKFARRGLGIGFVAAPLPAFPTDALPGSEEKIAVLTQRAALRQELFHPQDAEMPGRVETDVVRAG